MMQFEVKVYLRRHVGAFAKVIVSNENDLQELYDSLKSDSPVFNFGNIWIMKKVIKYVTVKEKH